LTYKGAGFYLPLFLITCYNFIMLKIEHLKKEEIPRVYEIESLSFSAPKSESIFYDDQNKYLVAKNGGEIVGFIGIEELSGEKHIINMAVAPSKRRRGIGKKLIENIINSEDVFFLEVRVSNIAAKNLYEKYGFKCVGIRKKYYNDNGEDAFIMRKDPNE
jgi:[ribosomal protein S18]-alanine N-acetyltransferase